MHIRDPRDGIHKQVKYAAYIDNRMLDLRSYMIITEKDIEKSVKYLTQEGIVLVGHGFNIYFYGLDAVDRFITTIGVEEMK